MTKAERATMYQEFLVQEGYRPTVDAEGDISFKYEGRNYYILIDEKDDVYFRLGFLFFWAIENETERAKAKEAAMAASAETKAAKVVVVKDNTHATIEMFCSPPEAFKPVFNRCMSALNSAAETFRQKMRE